MGSWIKCDNIFPWQITGINGNMRAIYQGCIIVSNNQANADIRVFDANTGKTAPEGALLFGSDSYTGSIINSTQDTRLIIELPRVDGEGKSEYETDYYSRRDLSISGSFNVIAFRSSPDSDWRTSANPYPNMSIGPGLAYHDEGLVLSPVYLEIKVDVIGGPVYVSSTHTSTAQ
jgi:hypothetical protein